MVVLVFVVVVVVVMGGIGAVCIGAVDAGMVVGGVGAVGVIANAVDMQQGFTVSLLDHLLRLLRGCGIVADGSADVGLHAFVVDSGIV